MTIHRQRFAALLALMALLGAALPRATAAPAAERPTVWQAADGVHVRWSATAAQLATLGGWDQFAADDVTYPVYPITVYAAAEVRPVLQRVAAQRWAGALPAPTAALRPADAPLARPLAAPPSAPVFVVRQGREAGIGRAVVAISPIFEAPTRQAAQLIEAVIPGATLQPPLAVATVAPAAVDPTLLPTNPAAIGTSWTIRFASRGCRR